MTAWTRAQVEQVRGLRAESEISVEMLARSRVDVLAAARERMAKRLVDMAHPFAVEPHLDDFQIRQRTRDDEDENPFQTVEVECWWEPDVRVCEMRGGATDGTLIEVQGAPWQPFMAMESLGLPAWTSEDEWVEPRKLIYEMTGWSEDERHWIYEAS